MKFTTARRLIKEHKKDGKHSPELIEEAHRVCHEYHDKVARGLKAEKEIEDHVIQMEEKMRAGVEAARQAQDPGAPQGVIRLIPNGMTAKEFAKRQVKLGRQGNLDPMKRKHQQGKVLPWMGKDADGNDVPNYDPMGNEAETKSSRATT